MSGFIAGAGALTLFVVALLLWPLLGKRGQGEQATRSRINARVYRQQLAELEEDRANHLITGPAYEQAKTELERRALNEIPEDEQNLRTLPAWPVKMLVLLVPVGAIAGYLSLGTPSALLDSTRQHEITVERIHRMVGDLAKRLENNPGDLQGWSMLGRAYKVMGRLPEAISAFEKAGNVVNEDPQLLIDYAEALALHDKSMFQTRGVLLLERALKLDPENLAALVFSGTAAYDRADYRLALRYWQTALKQLPPDSNESRALGEGIERAEKAIAEGRSKGKSGLAQKNDKQPPVARVSGTVTLAPSLAGKLGPEDTVFVFARASEGSRAPLAVLRGKGRDLPMKFSLDDNMAMAPGWTISSVKSLRVEARVSKTGSASATSGDLIGASSLVAPGATNIQLIIDQTTP
jgi:cytochrome c-type biogenesis protein CcmH